MKNMDLTEKQLYSKLMYDGNFITVRKDNVLLPDGKTSTR
jgi:hypothetical protein